MIVTALVMSLPVQAAVSFTVEAINKTEGGSTERVAPDGSFENNSKFPNINIVMAEYGAEINGETLLLTSDKGYSKEIEINHMFYDMGYDMSVVVKINNEDVTESGVYTLHIPAGFIARGGESNEAMELKWTYTNTTQQGGGEEKELALKSFFVNGEDMLLPNPALKSIKKGDPIEINIDPIPEAVMLSLVFTSPEGEIMRSMEIYKNDLNPNIEVDVESGRYKTVMGGGIEHKFLIGKEYTATIEGYNTTNKNGSSKTWGPVEVKFAGASEPYKFSDAKIVSVSPENGAEVTDITTPIVITFSAPVETVECVATTGGQGANQITMNNITSSADKTVWTISPGTSFWKNSDTDWTFMIKAKDAEGLVVEGTNGVEVNSYYTTIVGCFLAWPEVDIVPGTGMLEELYQFSIENSRGIGLSYNEIPYVVDADGNEVARVDMDSQVQYDASGRDITTLEGEVLAVKTVFNLNKAITEPGLYTLIAPRSSFAIGTEFDADFNRYMEIKYQVVKMPKVKVNVELANFAATSFEVLEGRDATVSLQPSEDWKLATLTLNGEDVTSSVVANAYTLKEVKEEASLVATYEFAHEVEIIETSGIVSVEDRDCTISTTDNGIQIENLKVGDVVKVYTVNGMSIAQMTASQDIMQISAPKGQVYVVVINCAAVKVKY